MLKEKFQIKIDQYDKEVLIKGLTLDRQMTKHFDQKMDWKTLKKMTSGKVLMDKLTQASKSRYSFKEMP